MSADAPADVSADTSADVPGRISQVIIQRFSTQMSNLKGGWNEVKWVAGMRLFI